MRISIHPRPYDIEQGRRDKNYGRFFTTGWESVELKKSSDFARIITSHVWSPIKFKDGYRKAENFLEAQLLVLDFDSPEYTLQQAIENDWCDTFHWIGTTKSHQREKGGVICDRFRLIVPYTCVIHDSELYTYNYQLALGKYAADKATKDRGRLFFPCQQLVSFNVHGPYMQDIEPVPLHLVESKKQAKSVSEIYRNSRVIPRWIRKHFEVPIELGTISHTIYGVSIDLAHYGFTEEQIVRLFLASPTFAGRVVSPDEIKRIHGHVRNGVEKAKKQKPLGSN